MGVHDVHVADIKSGIQDFSKIIVSTRHTEVCNDELRVPLLNPARSYVL